jgi:hypothetical protein
MSYTSFTKLFADYDKKRAAKKAKAGKHNHVWEDIGSFGPVNRKHTFVAQQCKLCWDTRSAPVKPKRKKRATKRR